MVLLLCHAVPAEVALAHVAVHVRTSPQLGDGDPAVGAPLREQKLVHA